ncbi:MAG: hypothetical protein IPP32_04470 [Bacteroidetes bacterium]|nr:hypothetical protein [Bacteroidota bacterium]
MSSTLSQYFSLFSKPITLLFASLVSYWIYDNQDLISDDNIHAFLMAIAAIVAIFTLSGSWDYLTDGKVMLKMKNWGLTNYQFTYFALSIYFAYHVFLNYSPYMFDDSAFTLRYLDNFWDGYFYHYNKSDPPVFGISCFSFGIFTGLWCYLHLLSPEQSIHLAGFIGLILVSFLSFKILRETISDNRLILISWIVVIFSSKMLLNVAKSGMESSFHVSIVLAALLFFLQNKPKWMWLFLAFSVISKLDAVPLVMVAGITFLAINRKQFTPLTLNNIFVKDLLFFAVLPMILWIIIATLIFGSPLPQSAYSKIFLHYHPSDYWFPFFKYYATGGRIELIFLLFAILLIAHLCFVLFSKMSHSIKNLVFGFSYFAVMLLFYFYNPGEQMAWYYVLPDLLMFLQIAISAAFFIQLIAIPWLRIVLASSAIFFYIGYIGVDVIGGKYWMENYLGVVERERLEVGKYVGNMVGAKDSIMSNHGLPVRHVKGYVIDMSGLNSKFAADFKIDPELLFKKYHPQWAISHNSVPYAALLSANGYEPVRLFYDITAYTFPQWCLYKKRLKTTEMRIFKPIDSTMVASTKPSYNGGIVLYQDDTLEINLDSLSYIKKIYFGIQRNSLPYRLEIKRQLGNTLVSTDTIAIEPIGEYPLDSKYTKSIELNYDSSAAYNSIVLNALTKGFLFTIVEPYIYKKK